MNLLPNEQLEKYPPWKEALERFRSAGFQYDDIVPHAWFYDAFGMIMPDAKKPIKLNDLRENDLEFLSNFTALNRALLLEDQICLQNVRSKGWRVVPPAEQTGVALGELSDEMKRALRKAAQRVSHIKIDGLTDQQRKENTDARAKISSIAGLTKRINGPF